MTAIHFSRRAKVLLIWGGIAVALGLAWLLSSIITPFIWALLTAFILNTLVTWLTRRLGGPRRLWVVVVYFGLVALVAWGLVSVVPVLVAQIRQILAEIPNYTDQIESFLRGVQLGDLPFTAPDIEAALRRGAEQLLGALGTRAPELALLIFERLLKVLLYLVATFYLLLQADRVVQNVRALFPQDVLDELDPWIRRVVTTMGAYLRGQVLLVMIISTATFVGLSILGVRFALVLAIMSGLVVTIPYLGPYAAGAVAVIVAMTQTQPNNFGWPPLVLGAAVAILYTVIRQLEDNLVMPFVIGRTVELHPLTVIFVVLAGASLAGILGLLIAVPAAATLKIILEYLWQKVREPDPRESLLVGPLTSWDTIASRIRGARGRRLVVVVPAADPLPALLEPADYRRLVVQAAEYQVGVRVVTDDPAVAAQARAVAVRVDLQAPAEFARTVAALGPSSAAEPEPPTAPAPPVRPLGGPA